MTAIWPSGRKRLRCSAARGCSTPFQRARCAKASSTSLFSGTILIATPVILTSTRCLSTSPSSVCSPAGPNGKLVRGLGPLFNTIYPSYNPEFPFFGEVDFQGFDSLGRPVFGPRESSNGSGDITVGTKVSLIDANKHWFSMALGGYLKIPISSSDSARARGRTSGEYEFGPFLAFGQESGGKRFRLYENIGYLHTTDPRDHDVKYLDLPDKLYFNVGMGLGLGSHVEGIAEIMHTRFVGSSTPRLIENDPWEMNLGLRFFFKDGRISFGGGYRRFLNNEESRTIPVFQS